MTPSAETMLLAAGASAAAGTLVGFGLQRAAREHPRIAVMAAPLAVVVTVAAGVWWATRSMFISEHDATTVWLILLASLPVALAVGIALAHTLNRQLRTLIHAAAARDNQLQLDATRRELFTWASHDLRTPLAGMKATVEALQEGVLSHPARYYELLAGNVSRMNNMVEDLLDLSRLNSGHLAVQPQAFNVVDLLSDVSAEMAPVAQAARVSIELQSTEPGGVQVHTDPTHLDRVLMNLLSNAIRHSPAGGRVLLAYGQAQEGVWISVRDTCGGLSQEAMERVFDPGWQAAQERTPGAHRGAGLGLSIAHGLVTAMAGNITVTSPAGEDGCTFTVTLPAWTGS